MCVCVCLNKGRVDSASRLGKTQSIANQYSGHTRVRSYINSRENTYKIIFYRGFPFGVRSLITSSVPLFVPPAEMITQHTKNIFFPGELSDISKQAGFH